MNETGLNNVSTEVRKRILGTFLVGERVVCLNDRHAPVIAYSIGFLASAVPKRLAFIASRAATATNSLL